VLIRRLEYCDCPIQLNGYDCGLFAIGMVLHLVDGKNLTEETFKQENITDLRQKMATFLGRMALVNWTRQVNLSVAVFHNCVEVAYWIPSASR
jgi:Ulp1 family protease